MQDRPLFEIEKAGDEVGEGGLAAAARADDGQGLARRHGQIDVREDCGLVIVAVGDVFEFDGALERGQDACPFLVGDLRHDIEHGRRPGWRRPCPAGWWS